MKKTANAAIGPVAAVTNQALSNASMSAPDPTMVMRAATSIVELAVITDLFETVRS
tara:strand:+ start:1499 stop:1666 length:168 start_codon:yes stop_codon:yes gene_type:complete